jgi:copper chaperone CopZ
MHCSNCSIRLQSLEDDLQGVFQVDASYHKQQLIVRYDETVTNLVEIIRAIAELGYTAVEAVNN